MILYHYEDVDSKAEGGRMLDPGESFYLHTKAAQPQSWASNIVGTVATYSITIHVYAEGTPGEAVEIQLFWDDTKTSGPNSGHYKQTFTIPESGLLQENVEFKRAVAAGYAVYARCRAIAGNHDAVKVTRFDSDALAFKAA